MWGFYTAQDSWSKCTLHCNASVLHNTASVYLVPDWLDVVDWVGVKLVSSFDTSASSQAPLDSVRQAPLFHRGVYFPVRPGHRSKTTGLRLKQRWHQIIFSWPDWFFCSLPTIPINTGFYKTLVDYWQVPRIAYWIAVQTQPLLRLREPGSWLGTRSHLEQVSRHKIGLNTVNLLVNN